MHNARTAPKVQTVAATFTQTALLDRLEATIPQEVRTKIGSHIEQEAQKAQLTLKKLVELRNRLTFYLSQLNKPV